MNTSKDSDTFFDCSNFFQVVFSVEKLEYFEIYGVESGQKVTYETKKEQVTNRDSLDSGKDSDAKNSTNLRPGRKRKNLDTDLHNRYSNSASKTSSRRILRSSKNASKGSKKPKLEIKQEVISCIGTQKSPSNMRTDTYTSDSSFDDENDDDDNSLDLDTQNFHLDHPDQILDADDIKEIKIETKYEFIDHVNCK